ncbi:MAG: GNAT family N-acetyltransferase [bacterium]|nr:GNAT family N-acetyltransferase [bacterium]
MELRELKTKEEMLENFALIQEMYPTITFEEYSNELDIMLPHNYGQVVIYDGTTCAGLTGYWIGSKLWCGKYMELDNVVVSSKYRRQGIGQRLFEHMEAKAKELGCTMLALDSYTDNFEAHRFFYEQKYVPRGFHFINILDKRKVR